MAFDPRVIISADAAGVYRAAADLFLRASVSAVEARGRFTVALAGGSTPRGLYSLLATDPALRVGVPWNRTEFFWGDERHVPPDHADSNYRMAHETLLSRVRVPDAQIHRIRGEEQDPAVAAKLYESEMRDVFAAEQGVPRFDVILLGLGPDGHTASLFPGTSALAEQSRLMVANHVEAQRTDRITMTLPLLNGAREVIFVVAGSEKAPAVRDVLEPGPDAPDLPARHVRPGDGALIWVLDRAAAGLIRGR